MTEEEARQRLLAAAADDGPEGMGVHGVPVSGFTFAPFVPQPGVPVLSPGAIRFRVEEFAVLADGRRVRLHAERGFTLSAERGPGLSAEVDPWQHLTLESLEADVRATVLPDDAEATGEDHPWTWLADLLRAQGIETSPEELRAVPYGVEFSARLQARVAAGT
ncbi:hypothetical protein [Blastococcus sp. LR1]|uniref:hypothetical protein n=1 Tax=Blastococcus sp. LR1 TaxID=2877000 RepID=UPI001CC930EC|nr:hypothetical protein [Blastococcus sp. LR1]MCA0147047.1 hypothetical protein [Blastococcus sp. LR1]